MPHSRSRILSDAQVAVLDARRMDLGFSIKGVRARFDRALQDDGVKLPDNSVRMRFDRVFNPRLRRPASEQTLLALAHALEWSLWELEKALGEAGAVLVG